MKLEFDNIQEMISFLEEVGYEVKKGTFLHPYSPVTPNPFVPNYPYQPTVTYYDAKEDPNLSKKIMCNDLTKVDSSISNSNITTN